MQRLVFTLALFLMVGSCREEPIVGRCVATEIALPSSDSYQLTRVFEDELSGVDLSGTVSAIHDPSDAGRFYFARRT